MKRAPDVYLSAAAAQAELSENLPSLELRLVTSLAGYMSVRAQKDMNKTIILNDVLYDFNYFKLCLSLSHALSSSRSRCGSAVHTNY